ncbi:retinol dehydrogenase 12-like [Pollicipes pollicipes]|uniref:retinol dehydrogenase 12-like n=1 Tax=Pollicipes pollicipes TaxID=41117 RepID=UPI0018857B9B|nr:retinol dehydrogenase 12-like [Pollicipes pollicipes]XP_037069419.1 retinol dehydrogenase 12-like [Pollicipes pollicipes]XP_037069420.1 retinol dehydrogenase 12-like [Pollicipes pollicipes]
MSSYLAFLREDWQEFKREEQVALWTTYVVVLVLIWLWAPTALYLCIGGLCYLAFRRWMIGARCRSNATLEGKTAVVTGGNCGIGREAALELSRRGARVIIASRDVGKSRLAAAGIRSETGGEVIVKQLDLGSLQSVRAFADDVNKTEEKVHLLVNNAGCLLPTRRTTGDGHETTFQVNYLAPFLLTHLLTDKLVRSAPARVINVSSTGHWFTDLDLNDLECERKPYALWTRYGTSKLAQILHARELARRLRQRSVTAFSLHPGVVNTDIYREQRGKWYHSEFLKGVLFSYFFRNARMGAQTVVYCAVEPTLTAESGGYYSDCRRGWASAQAQDDQLAAKLWAASEKMLGLE